MADNLVDILKGYITPDVISKANHALGESESGISKAMSDSIPAVLGGLLHKSSDSGIMASLMSLIESSPASENIQEHLSSMPTGSGSDLFDLLFGDGKNDVVNAVAQTSGIKKSSALSILGMVCSLVLGYFAKTGVTKSGLTDLLSSQRDSIMAAVPAGFNLGFAKPVGKVVDERPHYVQSDKGSGMPKWLLPLGLILGAILVIYFLSKSCEKKDVYKTEEAVPIDTVTTIAADTVKTDLGKFFRFKLPNGVELNAPEYGIENKLHTSLMDKAKNDTVTWFNFDRLLFDTGKATLRPESQEQLTNMVEILKAYPTVELKIGGYTDNVGNPAANMKLSDERSKSVMNEMIKMGVNASRLRAEGYGEQFPVAPNETEEGRAQNRRIAVRVIKR